ncbi:hypothetical protein FRB91_001246, partial [Serendipita sp. 411]
RVAGWSAATAHRKMPALEASLDPLSPPLPPHNENSGHFRLSFGDTSRSGRHSTFRLVKLGAHPNDEPFFDQSIMTPIEHVTTILLCG